MKKIYLVFTPFFPSKESFRGSYIYDQVKAIKNEGSYDVVVFKPIPFYSQIKDYTFEGVHVFHFKVNDLPSAIFPGIVNKISFLSLNRKLRKLKFVLNEIEVVHSHVTPLGIYANYLKKKKEKIKTILQHHGFDVLSLDNGFLGQYHWHRNWVKKYGIGICNNIDLHVGVSAKTLDYIEIIPEIKMKSKYILYNGVDFNKFYPISGLKDNSKFTIGCIANFWPLKDQITLIKAVEILINNGCSIINLKFIGSGETLASCMEYVSLKKMNSTIEFLSEIDHSELKGFYNKLDLFVLPSYYEAFGCVYTEAYACGVPFIAVKSQGIGELISKFDVDNWLIDKGDSLCLSKLIKIYMEKPKKQNFTCTIEINKLINAFVNHLNEIN